MRLLSKTTNGFEVRLTRAGAVILSLPIISTLYALAATHTKQKPRPQFLPISRSNDHDTCKAPSRPHEF